MASLEYLVSAMYFIDRHLLPECSSLLTLLSNSVLFPANMGPMMSSILPFWVQSHLLMNAYEYPTDLFCSLIGAVKDFFCGKIGAETVLLVRLRWVDDG